jgi:1-aminocyclopropane-1-carboxylate deaminase/D-cysteine desulfhydrase-like pyridoxal-dependent ACC family enzyme
MKAKGDSFTAIVLKKRKRGDNVSLDKMNTLPTVPLGIWPTPLHRLNNFEKKLEYRKIYIKRDDMSGLGVGGNKIRCLEFLLGEAASSGCDTILVAGPLQSNLCTLTACACCKVNMKCICIYNGEEPKRYESNLLLNKLLGVENVFLGNVPFPERNIYAQSLRENLKEKGVKAYFIENGASTGMGALGYVKACVELKDQNEATGANIKYVFAPGGNGGVAAGLIFGNALLGRPFEIVIISVEYAADKLKEEIQKIILQIKDILRVPFGFKLEDVCHIIDDYRGEGWGINTEESAAFVNEFSSMEGIFIENIYTSKVLVGMRDMIHKKKLNGNTCYLHTGGLGSLFSQY